MSYNTNHKLERFHVSDDTKVELSNSPDMGYAGIDVSGLPKNTAVFTNRIGDFFTDINGVWYWGYRTSVPYRRIIFLTEIECQSNINDAYVNLIRSEM